MYDRRWRTHNTQQNTWIRVTDNRERENTYYKQENACKDAYHWTKENMWKLVAITYNREHVKTLPVDNKEVKTRFKTYVKTRNYRQLENTWKHIAEKNTGITSKRKHVQTRISVNKEHLKTRITG